MNLVWGKKSKKARQGWLNCRESGLMNPLRGDRAELVVLFSLLETAEKMKLACNFCLESVGWSGSGPAFPWSPWRLSTFFVRMNLLKSSRPFSRSISSSFIVLESKKHRTLITGKEKHVALNPKVNLWAAGREWRCSRRFVTHAKLLWMLSSWPFVTLS